MTQETFRDRQKQVREDAILDAAQWLLSKQDFASVTMDVVAAKVGISKATLYQHFQSKEDLLAHMISRCMRDSLSAISALDTTLPADVRLKKAFHIILEKRFGQAPNLAAARPSLWPLIKSHPKAHAQYKQNVDALGKLVDAAKHEGKISSHWPTSLIVQMFLSYVRDAEYEDLLRKREYSFEEMAEAIVHTLMFGFGHKPESKKVGTKRVKVTA